MLTPSSKKMSLDQIISPTILRTAWFKKGGGGLTQIVAPAIQQFIWTIEHTPLLNTHHSEKNSKLKNSRRIRIKR